jgi:hypothetical protein
MRAQAVRPVACGIVSPVRADHAGKIDFSLARLTQISLAAAPKMLGRRIRSSSACSRVRPIAERHDADLSQPVATSRVRRKYGYGSLQGEKGRRYFAASGSRPGRPRDRSLGPPWSDTHILTIRRHVLSSRGRGNTAKVHSRYLHSSRDIAECPVHALGGLRRATTFLGSIHARHCTGASLREQG